MKKLITLIAVAMFASTAVAGDKCKGTVILSRKTRQHCTVTYIPTAHSAARADIVDAAVEAGSFKTLVAAVKAAGLVETLKGPGPFTVFAPTDEAFAKLPEGTVANLLKPENKDQLAEILTYHVVPGKVLASDVVKICSAKTVNGKSARVTVSDAGVMIDRANVVATDIETSNGVIHVIDSVMLP
ncbi:MAG: fasciclin domain-containing protein [Fuerstiella sp.]|nr:fasciclin domain-containing protein [Fuerstiella sp.]